jgi:hypothetical protein
MCETDLNEKGFNFSLRTNIKQIYIQKNVKAKNNIILPFRKANK